VAEKDDKRNGGLGGGPEIGTSQSLSREGEQGGKSGEGQRKKDCGSPRSPEQERNVIACNSKKGGEDGKRKVEAKRWDRKLEKA